MHRIYEKYEIYRIKHDPTSTIGRFNPGYTVDWSPSILCIFNSIRCQLQSYRDHWKIIYSLLSMTKVELSVRITRSKYYSKKKFIRIIRLKEIKIFIRNCNDNFFLFWKFLFSHLFVISCNWTEVDTRQQWIIDSDEFKSNSFFFFFCLFARFLLLFFLVRKFHTVYSITRVWNGTLINRLGKWLEKLNVQTL